MFELAAIATGSSPLARGTLAPHRKSPVSGGLIPARAGNTVSSTGRSVIQRAHPRSRGEHVAWEVMRGGVAGSSPLARGTLVGVVMFSCLNGLIPARAGNTESLACS